MRQAGEILRFWIVVLGLVIGLQSGVIAAGLEGSGSPDQAVEGESSRAAAPIKDTAPAAETSASRSTTPATEAPAEKESGSSDQAVEGESSSSTVPIKEVAPAGETSASGSTAPATETSGKKESAGSDQAVEKESSPLAIPTKEVVPAGASTDSGPAAPATEASVGERDRDHSARSPQEMLFLFLKGGGALAALVLFYKGLKRRFGPKPQSE